MGYHIVIPPMFPYGTHHEKFGNAFESFLCVIKAIMLLIMLRVDAQSIIDYELYSTTVQNCI